MGTHPIFESDFDCLTDPSNPSQSVATPRSPSEASELSDREKLPSFLDDRRLTPERTVAPSPAAPSDPESSELSSSTNRRWLSRSSRPSRAPSKLLSLLPCE